jgi:molybdate transport system substrate-binding protein
MICGRRFGFVLALLVFPFTAIAAAPPKTHVRVFAAASLTEAFSEIAKSFEASHPGVHVELNLAGSQVLAAQLAQGAAADVFASADDRTMSEVKGRGSIDGESAVFAGNKLTVIVPRMNPARIAGLPDLARRGVKLVIAADAVPAGHYAREMFDRLGRRDDFPADYARRALANVVSEEENVRVVAGKVQLGEADAGVVYRTDVTPALARYVRALAVPDSANVLAHCPIATVAGARHAELARGFVEAVLSPEGQRALERRGFIPVAALP